MTRTILVVFDQLEDSQLDDVSEGQDAKRAVMYQPEDTDAGPERGRFG